MNNKVYFLFLCIIKQNQNLNKYFIYQIKLINFIRFRVYQRDCSHPGKQLICEKKLENKPYLVIYTCFLF